MLFSGGVDIQDTQITLTAFNNSGAGGGVSISAAGSGIASRMLRSGVSVTLKPGLAGASIVYAVRFVNQRGVVIDGGAGAGTIHQVLGNPDNFQGYVTGIVTNRAGNSTELMIDDSVIRNLEIYNSTNGGVCVQIGDDASDRTKANRLLVEYCKIHGSVSFQEGGGHGVFMCCTTDSVAQHIEAYECGIGLIIKRSTRGIIQDCTVRDMNNVYLLAKGSIDYTFRRITVTAHAGFNGNMFQVNGDTDGPTPLNSNGVLEDVNFNVDGATRIVFVKVDAGQSFTPARNNYRLTSGTLAAYPWQVNGVNYATFAAYKAAVEPTATSNIP